MEILTTLLDLLSHGVILGGTIYGLIGMVMLGVAFKDHQGPGIASALWQIVGGIIIIAAGIALKSVSW